MLKQADTSDAKHFIESMTKLKGGVTTSTGKNFVLNSRDPVADEDESNSEPDQTEMVNQEAKQDVNSDF